MLLLVLFYFIQLENQQILSFMDFNIANKIFLGYLTGTISEQIFIYNQ